MPIRMSCGHCGKQFSAWDDLRGKPVQCPKCKGQMIVPGGASPAGDRALPGDPPSAPLPPSDLGPLDKAVDDLPSLDEMAGQHPTSHGTADDLPSLDHLLDDFPALDEMPIDSPPPATQPPPPPPPPPAAPPAAAPPTVARAPRRSNTVKPAAPAAKPVDDFDDSDDLPIVCENCNQPLPGDEDLCDNCGYHRILKKVLDMDGVKRPNKSTGFERVLEKHLHESETAESALLWTKIAAAVGLLLLLTFILMCMGPVPALLCLCAGVALVFWLFRRSKSASASSVNRDPISDVVWAGLLALQRAFGWRLLEWPFPKTSVLTMHDPGFTDDDLAEFENLPNFETLDLERTQISDAGLVHFEGMKQLRYLVLRNTQVTSDGVMRLQGKLQKAMIWH